MTLSFPIGGGFWSLDVFLGQDFLQSQSRRSWCVRCARARSHGLAPQSSIACRAREEMLNRAAAAGNVIGGCALTLSDISPYFLSESRDNSVWISCNAPLSLGTAPHGDRYRSPSAFKRNRRALGSARVAFRFFRHLSSSTSSRSQRPL